MTAAEQPMDPIYEAAVRMGLAGYKIIRVSRRSKVPFDKDWVNLATNSAAQIDEWFQGGGDFNLGLACGLQPNGLNIVAIDIDPKSGGVETWAALVAQHGKIGGPRHTTPSGGFHLPLIFPAGFRNTRNKLGPGIDTRGEGGQILLPPSTILVEATGELLTYGAPPGRVLTAMAPIEAPEWLVEALSTPPAPSPSQQRHPSSQVAGDHPADWMRHHFDWQRELSDDKMIFVRHLGNGDEEWKRPGSSNHHSLTLHVAQGVATVWSDNCPAWMQSGGWTQAGGALTINAFTYYTGKYHGGDVVEAMSHIRREFMPPPPPRRMESTAEEGSASADSSPLIHPPEFWSQLPLLAHIRDAAWSMGACPDAQLHAWLAHYATAIPPEYIVPPMVGDISSFDLLTVLVGPSGAKKSSTMRRAEHLTPLTQRKDLQMGLDISSGEGIIDAYYDMIPEDETDPKSKKVRGRAYKGICFRVDEGKVISDLNQRQGTTHTSRLCTAFSGGTLSTPNASTERKRFVPAGTYRLTAVVAAQEKYAVAFLTGDSALQGFSQRLLWAWCVDPTKPDPDHRPVEPGPLNDLAPIPPNLGLKTVEYDPEIIREVMWADHKLTYPDPLDAHRMLITVKLAGILALSTGSVQVGLDMWAIAKQIVAQSVVVRTHVLNMAKVSTQRDYVDTAQRKGVAAALQSEATDRELLGKTVDVVTAKLKERDMTRGDLRRYITGSKRDHLDAALAVLEGMAKVSGGSGEKWHWIG